MKNIRLHRQEKEIEQALLEGEYMDIGSKEFEEIASAVAARKKDAVLNVRVNGQDLKRVKQKAKRLGVKYQTLISEFIHRLAA